MAVDRISKLPDEAIELGELAGRLSRGQEQIVVQAARAKAKTVTFRGERDDDLALILGIAGAAHQLDVPFLQDRVGGPGFALDQ
jgi:hypothetical protein